MYVIDATNPIDPKESIAGFQIFIVWRIYTHSVSILGVNASYLFYESSLSCTPNEARP
jgi:hypothetical protein